MIKLRKTEKNCFLFKEYINYIIIKMCLDKKKVSRVATTRCAYSILSRNNAILWQIQRTYSGSAKSTNSITVVCTRTTGAPCLPKDLPFQDQDDLRNRYTTLYNVARETFLCGLTIGAGCIDYIARLSAGPVFFHGYLLELASRLRKIKILGKEETVVPFSQVINECVVPYSDNLMTIGLQIIKNGYPTDENINIFETFKISRVKCNV